MSWKKFTKNSFEIAKIDYERYKIYRINIIIKIIKHWLYKTKFPTIVCLQEVNQDLLDKLTSLYSRNNISWSSDSIISDYRVTIVMNCKIINSKNIVFNNKKNTLLTTIKLTNNFQLQCANVHFHWSWKLSDLDNAGIIIKNNLDDSLPFIIAGDFNKPIELLESFMDHFDCIQFNKINKGYTSYLTHLDDNIIPTLGIIDHILLSSDFIPNENTKIKILSKVIKYKIFYNFKKILKIKNLTSEKWINNRNKSDISDHKPIKLKINIDIPLVV
jgi:endonuclease/exonuclease/phosphatase family metal-dependent hydrolase